ncbi:hypothetical protein [Paenibacillus taichungensis]|uniref:hypothetical protein n=1 Tax=Paenibacillus taichungensis TaxID=484184 RepID=UPI0039A4E29A
MLEEALLDFWNVSGRWVGVMISGCDITPEELRCKAQLRTATHADGIYIAGVLDS